MSAFLSRRSRAIDPHIDLRWENGALLNLWQKTQHYSQVGTDISGNLWSFAKRVEDPFEFQGKRVLSLETLQGKMASSSVHESIS